MADYFDTIDDKSELQQLFGDFNINELCLVDNTVSINQEHSTDCNNDTLQSLTERFTTEYDNISNDLSHDIQLGSKMFKPIFTEDFWYDDLIKKSSVSTRNTLSMKNLIISTLSITTELDIFKYFCYDNFIDFNDSLKRKCLNILFVYPEYRLLCISPSTVAININANKFTNTQIQSSVKSTDVKMTTLALFRTYYLRYLKILIMDTSCIDFINYVNSLTIKQQIIVYEFCVIMIYGLIPKNYLCTECINCRGCVYCRECIDCDLCTNCVKCDGNIFTIH